MVWRRSEHGGSDAVPPGIRHRPIGRRLAAGDSSV